MTLSPPEKPPIVKKEAWSAEQMDALWEFIDSHDHKELNDKMRPNARLGTFVQDACQEVFGTTDSKLMQRTRSRVARVKRDFLDYLGLLRDKERDPALADEEAYSKQLTAIYQRLPKSLIGLEVTFDLKEEGEEFGGYDPGAKRSSTPPVRHNKPLFRVATDKGERVTSEEEDPGAFKGRYKIPGYGNGARVEKVSESAPVEVVDKSIHINEDDIKSAGSKFQVSATEALEREKAEAEKAEKERVERLRLRKAAAKARPSLFGDAGAKDVSEDDLYVDKTDDESDAEASVKEIKKEAMSVAKPKEVVETPKETPKVVEEPAEKEDKPAEPPVKRKPGRPPGSKKTTLPKKTAPNVEPKTKRKRSIPHVFAGPVNYLDDSDSSSDFGSRGEMFSLPTSTPKATRRLASTQIMSSPTKRNSSASQRLSGVDNDDSNGDLPTFYNYTNTDEGTPEPYNPNPNKRLQPAAFDRPEENNGVTWLPPDEPETPQAPVVTPAPRKRGRPRKDAAPVVKPPKKKADVDTTSNSVAKVTNSYTHATASADASVSSNKLPQFLEGMQQFLSSVERLYTLADGDEAMKRALANLVVATTDKIDHAIHNEEAASRHD